MRIDSYKDENLLSVRFIRNYWSTIRIAGAYDLIRLARVREYVKNAFIFIPAFFGNKMTDLHAVGSGLVAFAAFSLLASSIYVFNDLRDIEADQRHPVKSKRPVASGRVSIREGYTFAAFLVLASGLLGTFLRLESVLLLTAYFVLNIAYSLRLKHIAVLDVVCVSLGFVLRIFIGTVELGLPISHWLVLMTFLLAMFLALAKRRDDLVLKQQGNNTRKCLDGYSRDFVSLSMILMIGVMLVGYILFTTSPEVVSRYRTQYLYLTTFWVILGILRYLQITLVEERSGSPTDIALKDSFLQISLGGWVLSYLFIIYFRHYQ